MSLLLAAWNQFPVRQTYRPIEACLDLNFLCNAFSKPFVINHKHPWSTKILNPSSSKTFSCYLKDPMVDVLLAVHKDPGADFFPIIWTFMINICHIVSWLALKKKLENHLKSLIHNDIHFFKYLALIKSFFKTKSWWSIL